MKKLLIALALAVVLMTGSISRAHSGRTDSQGCHVDKKTGIRHCH